MFYFILLYMKACGLLYAHERRQEGNECDIDAVDHNEQVDIQS